SDAANFLKEKFFSCAVGTKCSSKNFRTVVAFANNGSTTAVAKENTAGAILPINSRREHFRSDHEHIAGHASCNERGSDVETINETRTSRLNIKTGTLIRDA